MSKTSDRQSVIVKHVGNEDVERHINILGIKKKQRKTRSSCGELASGFLNNVQPITKQKYNKKTDNDAADEVPNDPGVTFQERIKKVTIDSDVTAGIAGANVYTFKTPKRAKQMNKFASESVKKIRNIQKSTLKENDDPEVNVAAKPNTPAKGTRQAKKFSLQEMRALGAGYESQSTEESGSDREESGDDDVPSEGGNSSAMTSQSRRIELPTETELYFEAHRAGRKLGATTSDRTLSKLKNLRMNREEMQTILKRHNDAKLSNKVEEDDARSQEAMVIESARQRLIKSHMRNFRKWMFYISNGYNILLYGLGSKRKLVHDFCKRELTGFNKVVVNGYFPSLTVKSILTSILEEVVREGVGTTGCQQQAQVDAICRAHDDEETDDLFIIIHNIDGSTLRNGNAQSILSQLSDCPKVHIIATIDHINASLVWDQSKLCKYKWLWFDVTTYEPYADETSYEDSLMLLTSSMGVGGSLALSGLVHVARSLTPNARGIFLLIVKSQMEEDKDSQKGLSFSDLYQQCREKFLVNSELTLRSQLTEFLDHKLVQIRKGTDGGEHLFIPLDDSTLQEYLDQAVA